MLLKKFSDELPLSDLAFTGVESIKIGDVLCIEDNLNKEYVGLITEVFPPDKKTSGDIKALQVLAIDNFSIGKNGKKWIYYGFEHKSFLVIKDKFVSNLDRFEEDVLS